MITRVTNHGDTLGIQFPKSLWEDVHISENDSVEIQVKNDAILNKSIILKKILVLLIQN
jgi:antitoxin component of MazEF toxin-antitoxin module